MPTDKVAWAANLRAKGYTAVQISDIIRRGIPEASVKPAYAGEQGPVAGKGVPFTPRPGYKVVPQGAATPEVITRLKMAKAKKTIQKLPRMAKGGIIRAKATPKKLPPYSKSALQAKTPAGRKAQGAFSTAKAAQQKVAKGKIAFSAAKTAQQKVARGKVGFATAKTRQQSQAKRR